MISCYGANRSGGCSSTISRSNYCDLFVFAGCGMAAAIADRVLLSLGDEDGGGGGSQCHDSSKYCLEKSTKDSLACGKCNIFSKD